MNHRSKSSQACAIFIVVAGFLVSAQLLTPVWTVDAHGLSVTTGRSPYWDFTNLWGGALLTLEGRIADLFDADIYRQDMRAMISPFLPDQEWSYPPSILLLGLPFAIMPLLSAYLVWTLGTLLLLFLSLKRLDLPVGVRIIVILSPAVCVNAAFGQNGALTAGLLLSGLLLAPVRPVIAGISLGLLTMKPQIGLLVPFCLLASGNYRVMASAIATSLLLVATTAGVFGWESWLLFLSKTRPLMTTILEAPYPQGYQINGFTFFLLARSLGLTLTFAYAVQAGASLVAISAASWIWRSNRQVDQATRVCVTALLGIAATPYGYIYDAIPLAVAAAFFFWKRREPMSLLCLVWLYPLVNHVVAAKLPLVGVLVPALLASWAIWSIWEEERAGATERIARGLPTAS